MSQVSSGLAAESSARCHSSSHRSSRPLVRRARSAWMPANVGSIDRHHQLRIGVGPQPAYDAERQPVGDPVTRTGVSNLGVERLRRRIKRRNGNPRRPRLLQHGRHHTRRRAAPALARLDHDGGNPAARNAAPAEILPHVEQAEAGHSGAVPPHDPEVFRSHGLHIMPRPVRRGGESMPEQQQEPVHIGRIEGGIDWLVGHDGRFTPQRPTGKARREAPVSRFPAR